MREEASAIKGRAKEAWLSSENSDEWAAAMMVCQSGAPWECSEAGECRAGDCFTTDRQGACVAWQMIQRLKSENVVVQRHLDSAVQFLRYGGEKSS
jgi:hypothetical protein